LSDLLAIAKFLVIYIASSPFAKAFNMLIAAEGYIQAHNITVKKNNLSCNDNTVVKRICCPINTLVGRCELSEKILTAEAL